MSSGTVAQPVELCPPNLELVSSNPTRDNILSYILAHLGKCGRNEIISLGFGGEDNSNVAQPYKWEVRFVSYPY